MFDDAFANVLESLRALDGRIVTIHRGQHSSEVQASVGETKFESELSDGVTDQLTSRDYFIAVTDYVIDDSVTKPQRGDQIVEAVNGVVQRYELLPMSGSPGWTYCDPSHTEYRIHTRLINETVS